MANLFEKKLARRVLALKKQGANVDNELARSARLVLDGGESPEDIAAIRRYTGIYRSQAATMRKGMGFTSQMIRTGWRASALVSSSGMGSAMVGLDVASGVESLVRKNRRTLVKIGEALTERLNQLQSARAGASIVQHGGMTFAQTAAGTFDKAAAGRVVAALGRGARLGGAVGVAAAAGYFASREYFSQQGNAGRAGMAAQRGFMAFRNREGAVQLEREAAQQAAHENLGANYFAGKGIPIISTYLQNRVAEKAAQRMQELMTTRAGERGLLSQNKSAQRAVSRMAAELGIPPELLSKRQQAEAIDREANRRFQATEDDLDRYRTDQFSLMTWVQRMQYHLTDGAGFDDKWREEIRKRKEQEAKNRLEGIREAADSRWHNMTPQQRLEEHMNREESTATFNAFRSRHKAVHLD